MNFVSIDSLQFIFYFATGDGDDDPDIIITPGTDAPTRRQAC